MTGNGGHKGRGGRTNGPSSRLSVGPEDDWRSWSKLPGEPADADGDADADAEPSVEELETKLRGSMMMVVGPTPESEARDGQPSAAPSAAPDATPPPATTSAPAATPVATRASASAKAAGQKSATTPRSPVAHGPTAAPPPLPRRSRADLPAPAEAEVTTELRVVASDAPPPSEAEGDAALVAGLPAMEQSFASPPPPARQTAPPPRPVSVATPAPAAPAPGPTLAIFESARRSRRPSGRSEDPAIVLVSGPEVDAATRRHPAAGPATPRATPARPSAARAPREGPSISAIVAEALSMLESQVAQQAEQTESLLGELESHYAEQIARLDDRVHDELAAIEAGVPKDFEDRVHASFMQLVDRLERVERQRSNGPAAVAPSAPVTPAPIPTRSDPGADAAIAFAVEEQNRLAAHVEELARRQDRAEAEHHALAEQNMQLAEAQQLVAAGAQRANEELQSALAHMAEMAKRVESLVETIPDVERRIVGLEQQTGQQLELLRARVDDLAERFPAVEESVELIHRQSDAIADLRGTMDQFRAALDHEISQVHGRLDSVESMRAEVSRLQEGASILEVGMGELSGRLDASDERHEAASAGTAALNADFLRLQAETDRRSSVTESRVLDLEDAIGGEVGVERNLLLDRIEEMERGLYELNPDQFVRRDELADPVTPSDDPFSNGPGH